MILAPMADVTDTAFREVIAKYGKPDICYTEFVSCDGLCHDEARKKLLIDFAYSKNEHPIIAQLFGGKPENFAKCAELVQRLGFDGIDINMGCPDRNVEKQGAGAALIKDPKRAQAIIRETKKGAGDLPVSVKTRIGYNKNTAHEWLHQLVEVEPAALIFHLRTRKEMSNVPADWSVMKELMEEIQKENVRPIMIGNGDVETREEAEQKVKETGADGVMIGRGIFGNPWLFNKERKKENIPIEEQLEVMIEHTRLFEKYFSGIKTFDVMKKHYKAYITGFDGVKEIRAKLMKTTSSKEVVDTVRKYFPNVKLS